MKRITWHGSFNRQYSKPAADEASERKEGARIEFRLNKVVAEMSAPALFGGQLGF